jgi:hypothetical protein
MSFHISVESVAELHDPQQHLRPLGISPDGTYMISKTDGMDIILHNLHTSTVMMWHHVPPPRRVAWRPQLDCLLMWHEFGIYMYAAPVIACRLRLS